MDDLNFKFFKIVNLPTYGPIVECPESVVIIPTIKKDHTLFGMIKIYRDPIETMNWEFPGGAIELGESPEEASIRELWEETGLYGKPKKIGHFFEAPGKMKFLHHIIEMQLDSNNLDLILSKEEKIEEFEFYQLPDIFKKVKNLEIASGATLSAIPFIY